MEDLCKVDGYPLVKEEGLAVLKNTEVSYGRKCLNEQNTHYYYWPDKWKNSGWILLEAEVSEGKPK